MKHFFYKISLLIITLAFFEVSFSQTNSYYQALVYFKTGVARTITRTDTFVTVSDSNVQKVLNAYGITSASIYPAFPAFNESDTIIVDSVTGDSIKQMDEAKVFAITTPDTTTNKNLIGALSSLPEVVYAEVNGNSVLDAVPNDPGFSLQWGLNNPTNPGDDIHAEAAWDIFTGNPSSIIAVIDHGVDITHPDVSAKIIGGDNSYTASSGSPPISHGTLIAGIAAASTNNSIGIAGVDWQAKILPQDFTDYYNCFCLAYLSHAHGDNLISQKIFNALDFNKNVWTFNHSYDLQSSNNQPGRYSITVREALAEVYKNNRLSCVSNGDYGASYPNSYVYPAAYSTGLLAVGSSDPNDAPSFYSYSGNKAFTSVIAPGDGIYSTNYNNTYTNGAGTSFATAFVSGLASLLKGYDPGLYNDDIINVIELSTNSTGNNPPTAYSNSAGYGRVNAQQALQLLQAPYQLQHLTATSGTVYNTSGALEMIMLGVRGIADDAYIVQRIEVRKTINLPADCSIKGIWGTGVASTGLRDDGGYCYGEGFTQVVPGSVTSTQATLRTFVYSVTDILGDQIGYIPEAPQNAIFAYSVLGIPQPSISGDNSFCVTSNPYTISNLLTPPGVSPTFAWSATPTAGVQVNSPTSNQTTLTNTNNSALVNLSVVIGNGCGAGQNVTLSKNGIGTGLPTEGFSYYTSNGTQFGLVQAAAGINSVCFNRPITTTTANMSIANATSTKWSADAVPPGLIWLNTGNNLSLTFRTIDQEGDFIFSATNGCGTLSQEYVFKSVTCSEELAVAPNPASTTITVTDLSSATETSVSDQAQSNSKNTGNQITMTMYDALGRIKRTYNFNRSATYTLNVNDFISGLYFLSIFDGTKLTVRKILIQK